MPKKQTIRKKQPTRPSTIREENFELLYTYTMAADTAREALLRDGAARFCDLTGVPFDPVEQKSAIVDAFVYRVLDCWCERGSEPDATLAVYRFIDGLHKAQALYRLIDAGQQGGDK
jgi:hypothetical protein